MKEKIELSNNHTINKLGATDRAFHDWYRFVLAFPPHLVKAYIQKFDLIPRKHLVLDPFCGTGTTIVESKKLGFESVGLEANPMAYLASKVKSNWNINVKSLRDESRRVIEASKEEFEKNHLSYNSDLPLFEKRGTRTAGATLEIDSLNEYQRRLIPQGFISPVPLKKVLVLKKHIWNTDSEDIKNILKLALAGILVERVGNIGFGPEIYRTKEKDDAPVLEAFEEKVNTIVADLESIKDRTSFPTTRVFLADARTLLPIKGEKIDAVITSPPYPNEKDYTRSTRLESVILEIIPDAETLRAIKRDLLKSNTRAILKGDDDDRYVTKFGRIREIAEAIENRRIELNKDSGFERLYHKVVTLYFGGMYRHLSTLYKLLNRGGKCAYVVGDQMSFFRIHIRTAELLGEMAEDIGYEIMGIDLWRERLSTATKLYLREEVLLLKKR